MGQRGPLAKTDERRQRRNQPPVFSLSGRAEVPKPPAGLLKATRERWQVYWTSQLAEAAREAHVPIVERLFTRYDERERAQRELRRAGRLTKGSQGQVVMHPLTKWINECDAEIRQLEDRLGLSPRGMAQLGATFATAQKSLDDLNSALESDDSASASQQDDDDSDPRLAIAR